jgi:7-keto-8-aminopelargonate synthetase-like enzyme
MDGDVAPLRELHALSREFDGSMLVDEAHALGIRGPRGRGVCAELGIAPALMTGTFGKAFGASGAFVAGAPSLVQLIENRARSYVFSTAPSPVVAAAASAALELVQHEDGRRLQLSAHVKRVREGLTALGYRVLPGDSPIVPVILGAAADATAFSAKLLELGFFVHGVRPPTVPEGTSRLRLIPIATHTDQHITSLIDAFRSLGG